MTLILENISKKIQHQQVLKNVCFVLNEGEIVGRGTHNELMENNEIYREIANSQLNRQSLTEE